ncbi:hypothetical protein [Arthrobacter sp. ISL-65]|uniref:hypothetical protein n=1 Tax=Arthrobacter sp. ISL-65 TaxID=2819112 RepID=UPI001BE5E5D7|nr:hypothetical protein [Arthrobacter sp. ISL-65]MBT2549742.1 hypothetical protein [Arthrobacter sp. ISL-65]
MTVKILNINRREVGQEEIALPFETDEQVSAAWDYLVENRSFFDFSYRPECDGEDGDRAYLYAYLKYLRAGEPLPTPTADQIRRLIPKIWQSEMSYDFRELAALTS